jgi:hypothetical protein
MPVHSSTDCVTQVLVTAGEVTYDAVTCTSDYRWSLDWKLDSLDSFVYNTWLHFKFTSYTHIPLSTVASSLLFLCSSFQATNNMFPFPRGSELSPCLSYTTSQLINSLALLQLLNSLLQLLTLNSELDSNPRLELSNQLTLDIFNWRLTRLFHWTSW